MIFNKNNIKKSLILIFLLSFTLLAVSIVASDPYDVDIHLWAYTSTATVKEITCNVVDSVCQLESLNQKDCCWGKNGCDGAVAGDYYVKGEIVSHTIDGGSTEDTYLGSSFMFECLDIEDDCNDDEECIPGSSADGGDGEGHCVQTNSYGDDVCRPTDPWCGDQYCDDAQFETCPNATRQEDLASCPDDTTQCALYACNGGCILEILEAGHYEQSDYPYTNGFDPSWECYDCEHCDGEGYGSDNCIPDCVDQDEDGYGVQTDPLLDASCCEAGSPNIDCVDDDENINPGSLNPYCDCDYQTGNGFTQGTNEGPIIIQVPITQDLCFDSIDNDCDTYDDCYDPDCSPEGYLYAIRNRTCNDDCSENYQTESDFDRGCCSNPSDCVIEGRCVQSGDLDGGFPDMHYCYNMEWYGGDSSQQVCNLIVVDETYDPELYSHWGLKGGAGNELCCGDDTAEYFTPHLEEQDSYACCKTPNATVIGEPGSETCCEDDLNEYFIEGVYGSYACCSSPDSYVLFGTCVDSLVEKYTWDRTDSGYCPDPNKCIVNPGEMNLDGTVENATDINNPLNNEVRCINDGDFIGDHYCSNGEWNSRTAAVATNLFDSVQGIGDISIFCDNYKNALNYYGYVVGSGYAEYYLGVQGFQCEIGTTTTPCTNNICVLKYKSGDDYNVVIGASLNNEVNSQNYPILEALGGSRNDCDGELNSTMFSSCGTGAWYNNKIKSVIYSKDSIVLGDVLVGNWSSYLNDIFKSQINHLRYNNPSSYDYSFVTDTQDFNKIYYNKKGNKVISIITEEIANKKYMSVRYTNFATDICSMIDTYVSNNPQLVPLDCIEDGSDTYVTTGGLSAGYYDLLNDLGPKLRIE